MVELTLILLLAILVQFVVDRIKILIPYAKIGKIELAPIYATIVGIVVAFVAEVDILASLGFHSNPTIGYILTGLVVSGGATAVHELIAKLRESRKPILLPSNTDISNECVKTGQPEDDPDVFPD